MTRFMKYTDALSMTSPRLTNISYRKHFIAQEYLPPNQTTLLCALPFIFEFILSTASKKCFNMRLPALIEIDIRMSEVQKEYIFR